MPSLHTPWWHGSGTQSLMLSLQSGPVKPSAHSQSYPLGRSMHLAPFKQGVLEHSSMSIWHISPLKPAGHSQTKRLTWSRHLPWFKQGELMHSFTSISQ